jgi:uncharacterized protein
VSGFVALAMLKWSAKTQLKVGIAWFLAGSLFLSVVLGGQAAMESLPQAQQAAPARYADAKEGWARQLAKSKKEIAAMSGDSYAGVVEHRIKEESGEIVQAVVFGPIETIPLMLIGMALYRMGLFERKVRSRPDAQVGLDRRDRRRGPHVPIALLAYTADFPLALTLFAFNGPAAFLHLPMILGLAALLALWAPRASQTGSAAASSPPGGWRSATTSAPRS